MILAIFWSESEGHDFSLSSSERAGIRLFDSWIWRVEVSMATSQCCREYVGMVFRDDGGMTCALLPPGPEKEDWIWPPH